MSESPHHLTPWVVVRAQPTTHSPYNALGALEGWFGRWPAARRDRPRDARGCGAAVEDQVCLWCVLQEDRRGWGDMATCSLVHSLVPTALQSAATLAVCALMRSALHRASRDEKHRPAKPRAAERRHSLNKLFPARGCGPHPTRGRRKPPSWSYAPMGTQMFLHSHASWRNSRPSPCAGSSQSRGSP